MQNRSKKQRGKNDEGGGGGGGGGGFEPRLPAHQLLYISRHPPDMW